MRYAIYDPDYWPPFDPIGEMRQMNVKALRDAEKRAGLFCDGPVDGYFDESGILRVRLCGKCDRCSKIKQ